MIAPLAFVLAVSLSSQPPKQIQPGTAQQQTASQDKRDTTPTINVTVTTPEKTAAEKEAERQRSERQDLINERIAEANDNIALLTFWLVIVGAAEAIGTVLAFTVGIRAANAAKKSAQIAETVLKTGDRPWVLLRGVAFERPPKEGRPIMVKIVIQNYGKSPALKVFCGSNLKAVHGYITKPITFVQGEDAGPHTSSNVLAPGQPTVVSRSLPALTSAEWDQFIQGDLHIYVGGTVTYTSTTGLDGETEYFSFNSSASEFAAAPVGNSAK